MSAEPIEFSVDGVRFRMVMLGGVEARGLALRVLRMLGPAAGGLASPDAASAGTMLGILANVSEDDLNAVADALGKVTEMQVEPGSDKWRALTRDAQNVLFRGRLKLQFGWLGQAIRGQLADFFG
jgi:hypothetical protein